MFSGLTRQEQRVLLFLIVLIGLGLTVDHVRSSRQLNSIEILLSDENDRSISESLLELSSSSPTGKSGNLINRLDSDSPKININTAEVAELAQLYRIGPSRARAIIDYRDEHGPYRSVEELQSVSGIGPKTVDGIRPRITVGDIPKPAGSEDSTDEHEGGRAANSAPAKININTADEAGLCLLTGIDTALARRILEHRLRYGPFRTIEDIMHVPGIKSKKMEQFRNQIYISHYPALPQ